MSSGLTMCWSFFLVSACDSLMSPFISDNGVGRRSWQESGLFARTVARLKPTGPAKPTDAVTMPEIRTEPAMARRVRPGPGTRSTTIANTSSWRAGSCCTRRRAPRAPPDSRRSRSGCRGVMHEPRARLEEGGGTDFPGSSRVMFTGPYDVFEDFRDDRVER